MRTRVNRLLRVFTTRTTDPNGRFGWAGVRASQSKCSPFAVFFPLKPGPYQLALPTQVLIGFTGSVKWATRGASIPGAMRNMRRSHRNAAQKMNSGCLIVCYFCYVNSKKHNTGTELFQPFSERKMS